MDTARKSAHNLGIIKDLFGVVRLEQITAESILAWHSAMLGRGLSAATVGGHGRRPRSTATVNRRLADLRAILRKAQKWGALATMPRIGMVRQPAPVERYLADREFENLLKACPAHLKRLVIFLSDTGAGLGEATGLTWGQVDLSGQRGRVTFTNTKSRRSRGQVPGCTWAGRGRHAVVNPGEAGTVDAAYGAATWRPRWLPGQTTTAAHLEVHRPRALAAEFTLGSVDDHLDQRIAILH